MKELWPCRDVVNPRWRGLHDMAAAIVVVRKWRLRMNWRTISHNNSLPWLLEEDPVNPGVRYFALRDLVELPANSPEVVAAREAVMNSGPVPTILAHQDPGGYWIKPGYLPKHNGTMWSIILLAQFGAAGDDPRIRRACELLFDYAMAEHGASAPMVGVATTGQIDVTRASNSQAQPLSARKK